ncbi:MAG: orotidine-5'-phosphate decarboxylase [Coriobacteriales bacterium]|jgi:orotidine-5'-phosphate decarboxylase|nr:orotidine-5'-phosphate decarboxylase [Coriobacteriales bacterium]
MDIARLAPKERLICALDTANVTEAQEIIAELDGLVSFFKIGITLHLASGLEIVNALLASNKRVFLDLKYYDVPETVRLAVREAARLGVHFLTIHGNNQIIKAAAQGRGEKSDLRLLIVTVLTSLDQADLVEMGYTNIPLQDLVLKRARNALTHGADGVISSAQEANLIKKETAGKLLAISPGIRPPGALADDQKRTMPASAAVAAGADFLVVGRPITAAPDRRQAAVNIIADMETSLAQAALD